MCLGRPWIFTTHFMGLGCPKIFTTVFTGPVLRRSQHIFTLVSLLIGWVRRRLLHPFTERFIFHCALFLRKLQSQDVLLFTWQKLVFQCQKKIALKPRLHFNRAWLCTKHVFEHTVPLDIRFQIIFFNFDSAVSNFSPFTR